MRTGYRLVFLLSLLISVGYPAHQAVGQALTITDCQGFTRALQSVDPGQLSNVDISVLNPTGTPANGVEVTLTNSATGEVTTAVAQNGVATFEGVSAGTYSVSSASANAVVGSVGVGTAGVGTAAATGVVATTTAVGGGTAATVAGEAGVTGTSLTGGGSPSNDGGSGPGGIGGGNNTSGPGGDDLFPTDPTLPTDPGQPSGDTTGSSGGSSGGSNDSSGSTPEEEDCPICRPNERPPSLDEDDFFDNPISPFA